MKAIRLSHFGEPDVLVPDDVDTPEPRPGWVRIRLHASALNWHDVLVRRGQYGSPLPHIPGADGAGIRTDTGEKVVILPSLFWGDSAHAPGPDFQILGDTTAGTYAEYVCVPEECVAPKPSAYSWEEAAALPLVGVTCFRALVTRAKLQPGESVLIIGAGGGVATMALSLALSLDAAVVVTGSSDAKLASAQARGALDGVRHDDQQWPSKAAALAPGGAGFDVVLDSVGLWQQSVRALKPGGRLVVLGANVADQASMDVRGFFFGQYSLLGTTMGGPEDFRGLLRLINERHLPPPQIAEVYDLNDAAAAHRSLEAGRQIGKIILRQS